jgi:predicted PurR-regulated permease PerM
MGDKEQQGTKKTQTMQRTAAQDTGHYATKPNIGQGSAATKRKKLPRGMIYFLVIAASIVFYFALLRLSALRGVLELMLDVLVPIVYGLSIAYLLNPIVKVVDRYFKPYLDKKKPASCERNAKLSRAAGITVAITLLLVIVFTLFNMMIPELYRSIRSMILTVPTQLNQLVEQIEQLNFKHTTINQFANTMIVEATEYIQSWMRTDLLSQINVVMSNVTVGVINVVSGLMDLLIGIIVSVYVLSDKEKFSGQCKKLVYATFKTSHANMILHLTIKSNRIFGGFIIGKIIDSAIIGVLCFLGLSILNMPYTLLVSVIVGVTNVIPFFGPYIGAVPSTILIMLSDPKKGLYFLIFVIILQQLDGNVIGPKILGNSTGLSPFWVMFAILLGGGMFGIPGMILGVPTFAVIYYICTMIVEHKLEKKQLPIETAAYTEMSYVNQSGRFTIWKEDEQKSEEEGK